jgi:hypothetical protein
VAAPQRTALLRDNVPCVSRREAIRTSSSKKLSFSLALIASLALAGAGVLAFGGKRSGTSPAHGAKFTSGLTPVQTKRVGNSTYAEYAGGTKSQLPSPRARSRPRKVTAHAAAVEQAATFSILSRDQTADEAADPILKTVAEHRSDLDVARARALDPARRYWLLPTNDGQVCLGQKTTAPEDLRDGVRL